MILIDKTGEIHKTARFGNITIVEYFNSKNCTIQFQDKTIVKNVEYGQIKKGEIKNPNFPNIYGIGYIGQGKITDRKIYLTWKEILKRCYSKNNQQKQPTYISCYISEERYNFQNFAEWFENNYREGFALDKDILQKGNKIYSPKTCAFVPQEINCLFTKRQNKRGEYPVGVLKTKSNRYTASFTKNKKGVHLGTFDTPEEAF